MKIVSNVRYHAGFNKYGKGRKQRDFWEDRKVKKPTKSWKDYRKKQYKSIIKGN